MQDDRFQDKLDGPYINIERALSSGNWTSRPKNKLESAQLAYTKRLLSRQKRFYMMETFHHMLKFKFLVQCHGKLHVSFR